MRTPNRRPRSRHGWFHPLTALLLLLSIVAPLAPVTPAAAQAGTTPPPLPAPTQVAIAGSFQTALGCPADFDPTCPATTLTDTGGGTWSGVLAIPAGTYSFYVVATSDQQRFLGEGGIPDGPEIPLDVPDGAAGVYFSYDATTGEIAVAPVRNQATLVVEGGASYAMGPDSQGGFEVYFDAEPGNFPFQVQIDGQAVAQDVISLDAPARVHVAVNDQGALTTLETVEDTVAVVTKAGADGAPQPGACFAVETTGGEFVGQACDADDGAADGVTEIRFANGLPQGQYVVTEVTENVPEPAADQPVELGPGETAVTVTAGGAAEPGQPEPTVAPTEDPASIQPGGDAGQLSLRSTDEQGNPLPGACFAVVELNLEECDDDGDGDTIFDDLAPGAYTVSERVAPVGFAANPDFQLTVEPGPQRFRVPHQADPAAAQPTEPVAPAAGVSSLALSVRDQDEAPVAGACFALTNRESNQSIEQCDADDGADDGELVFVDVPAGPYRLTQVSGPDGVTPVDPQNLDLAADQAAAVTVTNQVVDAAEPAATGGIGTMVITVLDEANNPVPQTCFAVRGPQDFGTLCDQQNDGVLNLPEIPSGEYTVEQTQTAPGLEPAEAETVQVPANGTEEVTVRNLPVGAAAEPTEAPAEPTVAPEPTATAEPTAEPAAPVGDVLVTISTATGEPPGEVCVTLVGANPSAEVCDNQAGDANTDPGRILLLDVPPGSYTLQVAAPEGFAAVPEQPVNVEADQTAQAAVELAAPAAATTGRLILFTESLDGQPLGIICYNLALAGETTGPYCTDEARGQLILDPVPAGDYVITLAASPGNENPVPNVEPAEQAATVAPGGEATVTFRQAAPAGSLAVTARDADGNPAAVCVTLTGPATIGPVCDNETGDDSGDAGRVVLPDVAGGDYTLQVQAPDGFEPVADQAVTIAPDQTLEIAVALTPTAPETGTLTFITADAAGQPLPGACYELASDGQTFGPFCDTGNSGQVILDEAPPAEYQVTLSQAPDGGSVETTQQTVTLEPGGEETVTFRQEAVPGSLTVTARDAAGNPVPFCAALEAEGEVAAEPICDNEAGDSDAAAGMVTIAELTAGDYTLTISNLPPAVITPAPQPVAITAGEVTTVDLTLEPAPGTLVIRVEDESGTLLPETCVTLTSDAVEGLTNICDAQNDGLLNFPDLPPGEYAIRQEQAAPDHQLAADQTVTIPAGETVEVTLLNPATPEPTATAEPTATLTPEPTATIAPTVEPTAEPTTEPTVEPTTEPTVAAEATVTPAPSPEATLPPAPTQGPAPTQAALPTPTPEPTGTGSVLLYAQDEAGDPIDGRCFILNRDEQQLGPFCTGDDPDGAAGEVIVNDLAAGVYEAITEPDAEPASELDQISSFQRAREQKTFTIRGGEAAPRVVFTFQRQQATTGDLLVVMRDEQNRLLAGGCFGVYAADEAVAEVCDGDRADGDGNPGRIRFDDLQAGSYRLSELEAPPGYQLVQDQVVEIIANQVRRVVIQNTLEPANVTTLVVRTLNNAGTPLLGACYTLQRGASTAGPVCGEDANDGITTFTDLQGGAYLLRQTQPPAGYDRAPTQALLVPAGQTTTVEVIQIARPGSVEIVKVDAGGELLGGACFRLLDANGEIVYRICDNEQNDADPDAGVLLLTGIAAGDYVARESRAPAGYQRAADQPVTVQANRRAVLEFEDAVLPPPPERGDLTIFKIGPDDRPLPGACFALLQDDQIVFGPRCDGDDGANDGTITFTGAAVGDFILSETRTPSGSYLPIEETTVSVQLNQTTELIVENQFRPGRILVRKIDVNQIPLQNACFVLEPSDGTPLCTNAAGNIIFGSLQPGTYRLTETEPPLGYLPADPVEGIVVNPGATTTVSVLNELAPPPPNTGSVQVVKFYCPAGADGEGTRFIDSSNPGSTQLAQTANCTPGDARFSLIATSGEGGPGEFATGTDGRYQTTLLAGDYNLNEIEPNLAGNTTEPVRISVNQLTTVVVLNYVTPPSPDPALVDVLKYTCAPGFQGTIFVDFVDGCLADENLTNNVTFRLSGPAAARRITGDLGQQGVTRFSGLGPGVYTLREEPPGPNLTVYAFCGLDPDNPELREVGGSIAMRLSAGQQVTCYYFNVPDDLSDTTGSIVIHKYGCAATTYPAGYDWFGECDPQGPGIQFALSVFDGSQFAPYSTGATSDDGLLRFNRLQPGTYRLQEIGAAWCHAESDSVDAQGDVVVAAGQRANVWIFNCLGTTQPPNTGAGPLAGQGGFPRGLGHELGGWPGRADWSSPD